MQFLYHLGVHATAPSYLAPYLSDNLGALRDQRFFFANAENPKGLRDLRTAIWARLSGDRAAPTDTEIMNQNIALARDARQAGAQRVLVLAPDLLGPSMAQALASGREKPEFYTGGAEALRLATLGLPLGRVRVLIATAPPEDYLIDLYSAAMRQGILAITLEHFCQAVDLATLDWRALSRRLDAVHPRLRIDARPQPSMRDGAGPFLRGFLSQLDLDPAPFAPTRPLVPPRLDAFQAEALLHISAGSGTRRRKRSDDLRDKITRFNPDPAQKLSLPDTIRQRLSQTARTDRDSAA